LEKAKKICSLRGFAETKINQPTLYFSDENNATASATKMASALQKQQVSLQKKKRLI
jgi:hypothetical protein